MTDVPPAPSLSLFISALKLLSASRSGVFLPAVAMALAERPSRTCSGSVFTSSAGRDLWFRVAQTAPAPSSCGSGSRYTTPFSNWPLIPRPLEGSSKRRVGIYLFQHHKKETPAGTNKQEVETYSIPPPKVHLLVIISSLLYDMNIGHDFTTFPEKKQTESDVTSTMWTEQKTTANKERNNNESKLLWFHSSTHLQTQINELDSEKHRDNLRNVHVAAADHLAQRVKTLTHVASSLSDAVSVRR